MKEMLFKCLEKGRRGPFSAFQWPLRKWVKVEGELKVCQNGIHLCTKDNLIYWLNEEIWETEARGERIESENKIIVREARLRRKLKTWNEKTARLFACDVARRVLPIYEKRYPGDNRPRKAIEAAEKYAEGTITEKELLASRDAAWIATEDVPWVATRDVAKVAARAATKDAARVATEDAARVAAWVATEVAVRDVARVAARAAARTAAWDAERKWQTKKLMEYLYPK